MCEIVSQPSHSWHTDTVTFAMPASPTSCTPLLFVSLKTVPHTPPDAHVRAAAAGVAATDASGTRTAASAATLMCFSGPSSNWLLSWCGARFGFLTHSTPFEQKATSTSYRTRDATAGRMKCPVYL